jgi:hypothetical protein
MRGAAHYYLAQARRPRGHRQSQPDAPPRAANQGRHAPAHRRSRAGRELPAAARRVLAALSGTS